MKTLFTLIAMLAFTTTTYAATPSNPTDANDTHLRLNFLSKRPYTAPVAKSDANQPWEGTSAVKPVEKDAKEINNINNIGRQPFRNHR